jgi:hypothetical protein
MSLKNNSRFSAVIAVAVLCGLAAGVLGEIVTRVYLLKDFSSPYLTSAVNIADLNSNRSNLIIQDAKKVVVNQDVKVAETLNSLRPTLVGVFKTLDSKTILDDSPEYYKLTAPLLVGLIITSDGWVVAPLSGEFKKEFNVKNYSAITGDRKIYQIDQIEQLSDFPGDLVLFHLAGAANLPVKKIVAQTDLAVGVSLLAINGLNEARPLNLSSFFRTATVLSSDSLNARFGLAGDLADLKNTFVFNLAGDLALFINAKQEIIPAFSYSPSWQSILNKKPVSRPYLGVNYLDLSQVKPLNISLEKGALLYPTPSTPAVLKNSPAALAGFKVGDIITWIDNQEINDHNDLANIIASYNSGDIITITYLRAGAEKEITVKLGTLK